MKENVVQVKLNGTLTIITFHGNCPLWKAPDKCSITGIECRFGLTEIKVPTQCPLHKGIKINVL